MKKKLIIGAILLGLLILAFAILVLRTPAKPAGQQEGSGVVFPTASSTPLNAGQGSGTHIFLDGADVKEDSVNKGYYYLGYQPASDGTSAAPYLIEYIADTKYFGITILQEPLGQVRRNAEQYLKEKLGLSNEQMCSLQYQVSVPEAVNSQFASMSLGFSFCPGAVKLPQ